MFVTFYNIIRKYLNIYMRIFKYLRNTPGNLFEGNYQAPILIDKFLIHAAHE